MSETAPATIFALSTAPGRAAVAVVRISGPGAGMVLNVMAPRRPKPRVAGLRRILHPETGAILDRALVLWFPSPRSETGEDLAEIQIHGGRAVTHAVLEALARIPGCRLAEPGEFARRAFENGKKDLAEIEGLADLIDAETEAQRRQAASQATGALSAVYETWRRTLIDAIALVEAAIDFSDEGDIGTTTFDEARGVVTSLETAVRHHLDDAHRGEILRRGFRVALTGPPNVGKSSLLNALARREAAIVSEEAGTTRDVIEVSLDLDGFPIVLSDTAGLREADGQIEMEGIRRSYSAAQAADLVIWLMDAHSPEASPPPEMSDLADRTLHVLNKIDLLSADPLVTLPDDMIAISATTGHGLDDLTARLAAIAAERLAPADEPSITRTRHRTLVETCAESLANFLTQSPHDVELRAEDLRRAAHALGRITGRVDVEDVLDELFRRFCVGK
jgi:tRNA modification GTPase